MEGRDDAAGEQEGSEGGASAEEESAPPSNGLPPLELLVERVPAELRATLTELFGARFTRVTRVAPKPAD